jgi:hypothetical protein
MSFVRLLYVLVSFVRLLCVIFVHPVFCCVCYVSTCVCVCVHDNTSLRYLYVLCVLRTLRTYMCLYPWWHVVRAYWLANFRHILLFLHAAAVRASLRCSSYLLLSASFWLVLAAVWSILIGPCSGRAVPTYHGPVPQTRVLPVRALSRTCWCKFCPYVTRYC